MRLVVDLNRCQGYAQCAFLAPDVFTMHGEEALLYEPMPDDGLREAVQLAVAACPVHAIRTDAPHLLDPQDSGPTPGAEVTQGARDGR
ncbi:ferredoxin [Streptomyces sp. NPDC006879]|uniref:ferredoxin n=1 Tax=Streptomyces sp. NPDC006879 TaxID=3364767 RepID=UPI0036787FDC